MTIARLLLFIIAAALAAQAGAAELAAKSSYADGVTVKVTPKAVAPEAAAWEFAVALDTHTKSLDDDLAKSALLVDAGGGRHAAISWEGAAPGGHHREGLLRFKPLPKDTEAFELVIIRPGEQASRTFRWVLK